MSLLKIFKRKQNNIPIPQASATLYPDFILITTDDKTVVGYSITTTTITKLPLNASMENIGSVVRKHMALSKTGVPAPTNFKTNYQDFLRAAGFKNAKSHHKAARHLTIYQKDEEIIINPTNNEKKSFIGTKDLPSVHVNSSITDKELGELIKGAWLKCIDNSV